MPAYRLVRRGGGLSGSVQVGRIRNNELGIMGESKKCKQCDAEFKIEAEDLEFYKKMSPTFDGKVFNIPTPTLCPDCRRRRRCAWRNMKIVYSRKCDMSKDSVVSPFAPNSNFKVYKNDIWWSDKWDPLEYGQDFDDSKLFFDQLYDLQLKVPNMHAFVSNNENSDFCNCTTEAKDSYLVQSGTKVENCYYSQNISRTKDSIDCMRTYKSESCYECALADNSYDCSYLTDSDYCSESYFLDYCTSCKNCFACANLRQKQYWIYNKESTKEEFEKVRNEFLSLRGRDRDKKIKEIRDFLKTFPKKHTHALANENFTGDYVYHCKNVKNSFMLGYSENITNCFNLENCKDSLDHDFWGEGSEKVLESEEVGDNAYNIAFCQHCWGSNNLLYCIGLVNNSRNCFGCVNLKGAEYCIFNKQYTKEEYEKKVAAIIEHMKKTGEWGEFFPMKMSYFAYNESAAYDYFPIDRNTALSLGAKWQDEEFGIKYDGPFYEPEDTKEYVSNNEKVDEALKGILKCQATGKPFKLQPGEIAFYIKKKIQIPIYHPDYRYDVRFKLINPLHLWHRKCMNEGCSNEFETSYSPERPEKIFCEDCYQKEIK
jgi:hypothetical protein